MNWSCSSTNTFFRRRSLFRGEMTVSYNAEVQTSSFACFLRLLFRWRGGVLKLIWRDLLLFASCYLAISLLYHFVLDCQWKECFYLISKYCEQWFIQIPLTFVLGTVCRFGNAGASFPLIIFQPLAALAIVQVRGFAVS